MPSRIIRESCRSSKSLAAVSAHAERLWWRLTTIADDFGRFEADPEMLKATCFPRKIQGKDVSHEEIESWFSELTKEMIATYDVGDKIYGVFINWFDNQTPRAKNSKFPSPPENICKQMQTHASKYARERERERYRERDREREREPGAKQTTPSFPLEGDVRLKSKTKRPTPLKEVIERTKPTMEYFYPNYTIITEVFSFLVVTPLRYRTPALM